MTFLLNNIVEIFSGLAALLGAGYVWYLKSSLKKTKSVNKELKESVVINRIINDSIKKQYENKAKLDDEKAKLKEAVGYTYTE